MRHPCELPMIVCAAAVALGACSKQPETAAPAPAGAPPMKSSPPAAHVAEPVSQPPAESGLAIKRGIAMLAQDRTTFRPCDEGVELWVIDQTDGMLAEVFAGELQSGAPTLYIEAYGERAPVADDIAAARAYAGTLVLEQVLYAGVQGQVRGCDTQAADYIVAARGSEPFWAAEVRQNAVTWRQPDAPAEVKLGAPQTQDAEGAARYQASADGHELELSIDAQSCRDPILEDRSIRESRPESQSSEISAITEEIQKAFDSPEKVDFDLAASGEARQIIDLVWGAALTRYISITSGRLGKEFLSVGRVQSPTLALIVDREREIQAFVPQPYYEIFADLEKELQVQHTQGRTWEKAEVDRIVKNLGPESVVKSIEKKSRYDKPPAPFDTTSFISAASSIGFSAANSMRIAEWLSNGFISSRTDNTVYPPSIDLTNIFSVKGQKVLLGLDLSREEKSLLEALLKTYRHLETRIEESTALVGRLYEQIREAQLIRTIPGFGKY